MKRMNLSVSKQDFIAGVKVIEMSSFDKEMAAGYRDNSKKPLTEDEILRRRV